MLDMGLYLREYLCVSVVKFKAGTAYHLAPLSRGGVGCAATRLMQAAAAEKEAAAKAREAEVVRLRAQQERAADTQSQIDDLRARRCAVAPASAPVSLLFGLQTTDAALMGV